MRLSLSLVIALIALAPACFAGAITSASINATCTQSTANPTPPPNTVVDRDSVNAPLRSGPSKLLVDRICDTVDRANNPGLDVEGFHNLTVRDDGTSITSISAELLAGVRPGSGQQRYQLDWSASAVMQALIPLVIFGGTGQGLLNGFLLGSADGDIQGSGLTAARMTFNNAPVNLCAACPPTPFAQSFTFGVPFVWGLDAALGLRGPGQGGYSLAMTAQFRSITDAQGRAVNGAYLREAPEPGAWLMVLLGAVLVVASIKHKRPTPKGRP